MGIFKKINYIVNTGVIEQVVECILPKWYWWRRWMDCGLSV